MHVISIAPSRKREITVRITCDSRIVGPHSGPCFVSRSAYRICRWLRYFGKFVEPDRLFEMYKFLYLVVLRVKEMYLLFSLCELWTSAQEKKLNMMEDS